MAKHYTLYINNVYYTNFIYNHLRSKNQFLSIMSKTIVLRELILCIQEVTSNFYDTNYILGIYYKLHIDQFNLSAIAWFCF